MSFNNPVFSSGVFDRATTDFQKVRDQRRSPPFYIEIDLSTARSRTGVGANAPLMINMAGNTFYVDKNPLSAGAATVHFQDQTTTGIASTPIYCELGFIARVPFTQLMIENDAQAGKVFRIIYGTDLDLQPGTSSQVSITGNVSTVPPLYNVSNVSIAAGGAVNILPAASNVNGFIAGELVAHARVTGVASANPFTILAKATAPGAYNDGLIIATIPCTGLGATDNIFSFVLPAPIRIAAGLGIWAYLGGATVYAPAPGGNTVLGTAL